MSLERKLGIIHSVWKACQTSISCCFSQVHPNSPWNSKHVQWFSIFWGWPACELQLYTLIINKMIQVISNTIQISNSGFSNFEIKLTPSSIKPVIFKIKANHVKKIQVKPCHGLLLLDQFYSKKNIDVRLIASCQQNVKLKLQVTWLQIDNIDSLNINADSKILIQEVYRETAKSKKQQQKIINIITPQKFITRLQFERASDYTKNQAEIQRMNENFLTPRVSEEEPTSRDPFLDKVQNTRQLFRQTRIEFKTSFPTSFHRVPSQKTQEKSGVSFKYLIFLIALGLLLGISFGIKLQRLRLQQLSI